MLRGEARNVLGLPAAYLPADLEAAFRRQARRTHPDHGGDVDAFASVMEAHRVLTTHGSLEPSNVVFADDRSRLARLVDKLRRRSKRRGRVQ